MSREELTALCEARDEICSCCKVESCEKCIVDQLVSEAFKEISKSEENDEDVVI